MRKTELALKLDFIRDSETTTYNQPTVTTITMDIVATEVQQKLISLHRVNNGSRVIKKEFLLKQHIFYYLPQILNFTENSSYEPKIQRTELKHLLFTFL